MTPATKKLLADLVALNDYATQVDASEKSIEDLKRVQASADSEKSRIQGEIAAFQNDALVKRRSALQAVDNTLKELDALKQSIRESQAFKEKLDAEVIAAATKLDDVRSELKRILGS